MNYELLHNEMLNANWFQYETLTSCRHYVSYVYHIHNLKRIVLHHRMMCNSFLHSTHILKCLKCFCTQCMVYQNRTSKYHNHNCVAIAKSKEADFTRLQYSKKEGLFSCFGIYFCFDTILRKPHLSWEKVLHIVIAGRGISWK